jgi:hypothetical protein
MCEVRSCGFVVRPCKASRDKSLCRGLRLLLQVEVWVHIAEAQGLILDCKDYFAPIVTPYEAWLAFQDLDLNPKEYHMDLACLGEPPQRTCDFFWSIHVASATCARQRTSRFLFQQICVPTRH